MLIKELLTLIEGKMMTGKVAKSEDSPFVKSVYEKLVAFVESNKEDIEQWCEENDYPCYDPEEALGKVKASLADLERKGYSEQDAYSTLRNIEDLDPRIPEDRALSKMASIAAKYKK